MPAFRTVLRQKQCTVTSVPQDRWNHDLFLHPRPGARGKAYTFAAGVLEDIWGFDLSVFNLSPREATQMDPQQRLLMQVVWEALEDARLAPAALAGQRVGVYVGASSMDHSTIMARDPSLVDAYMMTGNTLSLVANRISHAFDLRGPSFVVDTACSSSLVALDQARRALASGDIDTAIVGGVNLLLNPSSFVGFSASRMLSPTGLCHSFSGKADGYVRAEGCVAVVLQRAQSAPRRAVARLIDSEVNADGFTMNVAFPAAEGQHALLSRLYERAGINPDDLAFVEAHGTGTLVGDPVEAGALSRALARYRDAPLPIGSSKTNFGHLEPASGLVGVLKTLLAFEDRRLAASLHADELNPLIEFEALNLTLARDAVDLPRDTDPIAGVSSFGFGGVNAHCILQAVRSPGPSLQPPRNPAPIPVQQTADRIIVVSAFCDAALRQTAAEYARRFNTPAALTPGGLADQMWAGRGLASKRLGVVADTAEAAKDALTAFAEGRKDARVVSLEGTARAQPAVFVYSGNGSQYDGMCLLALKHDPAYRDMFARIDAAFVSLAGWSLQAQLHHRHTPAAASEVSEGHIAQGLLFADQAAQTHALAVRGIRPDAVLGHSGGEIAAAWASGALTLEQAVTLLVHRSAMQNHLEGRGGMVALQAGAAEAEKILAQFDDADPAFPIAIAAINSPRSITLAGPKAELARFSRWVKREHRLACVDLGLDHPYHSVLLAPHEAEFRGLLKGLTPKPANVPVFSGTRGVAVAGTDLDVSYWWDNMRWQVRFQGAVQSAAAAGFEAFVEIGANPILHNYILASAKDHAKSVTITHTLSKSDPKDVNPISLAALRAVISGCAFSEGGVFAPPALPDCDLPSYQWQQTYLRATDSVEIERSFGIDDDYHPLLGVRITSRQGVWHQDLDEHTIPALQGHKVGDSTLLPATAFAEIAYAAASQAAEGAAVEVRDLDLSAPLTLSGASGPEVRVTADAGTGQIRLQSRPRLTQDAFRDHMQARFTVLPAFAAKPDDPAPRPIGKDEDQSQFVYRNAGRTGFAYSGAFTSLTALRMLGDTVEVEISDTAGLGAGRPVRGFDPVQLDCVLHGLFEASMGTEFERTGQALIPVRIGRIEVFSPGKRIRSGRLQIRKTGTRSMLADVTAFCGDGHPVVRLQGLRLRAAILRPPIDFAHHSYHFAARPCLPQVPAPSVDVGRLAAALEQAGPPHIRDDDSRLLITAAVHQAIWRAMRDQADEAGVYSQALAGHHAEDVLLSMLGSLALAQAAPGSGQWHIADDCDLPSLQDIAHSLMAERPDLIGDLSVLLCLPDALRKVLTATSGTLPTPESLFGREALPGLRVTNSLAVRELAAALSALAESLQQGNCLRIGLVGPDLRAFDEMPALPPGVGLVEILPPSHIGPPGQQRYPACPWAEAAGFDVVAITDANLMMQRDTGAWLTAALTPGGTVLVMNQDTPALARAALVTSDAPLPASVPAERLKKQLAQFGVKLLHSHHLPDGASGGDLLIAVKPQNAAPQTGQNPAVSQELPDSTCIWTKVWGDIHGPCKTSDFGCWRLISPKAEKAPLLMVRDPATSTDLAGGFLGLRDTITAAAATKRAITAILPHGAQYNGSDAAAPDQHALWCSLRTVVNEYPGLSLRMFDPRDTRDIQHLTDALRTLGRDAPAQTELVLADGAVMALSVRQGLPCVKGNTPDDIPMGHRLVPPASGRLDALKWQPFARPAPGPGEVEIEVAATGLNYRDVMWAMGLLPEEALETGFAGPTLGFECSGRVARVGTDVSRVSVGDPVLAFGPSCFASHLTSSEAWVTRLPPDLPPDQAATLPVAFFTAHYALQVLGQLRRGETVLIHGAAGGVGLAAIAVAQRIGARIIATAGSPVKQQLLREMGVEAVLSSRDLGFVNQLRDLTDGQGVDVVLNSLAGPAMERSIGLLRPFGRFLELGKQDYYANTSVGLRPLKNNISYFGIDVDSLLRERPDLAQRILGEVMAHVESGAYRPLPMTCFKGEDIVDAFRFMQRSGHIGKVIATPLRATTRLSPAPPMSSGGGTPIFAADPERWHVVAGGLGGLGLELAEGLHMRGARRLALLSRTGTVSPDAAARIATLQAAGAEVQVLACDIVSQEAVVTALNSLRRTAGLAGVYHAAMVLEDRAFQDVDAALLENILPVKTNGLDNLDHATRSDDLQAFVAFTSLATMIGNIGQSAYVAANAYQEAVILRRVSQGFCGLAIGLGAVTDAGYAARDETLSKLLLHLSGNVKFPVAVMINGLMRLLAIPLAYPCVTITPMNWSAATAQLRLLRAPGHEILSRLAENTAQRQNPGSLRAEVAEANHARAVKRVTAFLKSEIAVILRVSENTLSGTRPLAEYGMDSLMGMEMSLAAQQALGDDLPMPALGDSLTIEALAETFVAHIKSGGSDAAPAAPDDASLVSLQKLKRQHIRVETTEAAR